MSEIKIEFAVQISGQKCAERVRQSLLGVGQVQIDESQGRVIVETQLPWSEIQERIESTGRRAVLSGFGGKSAVAIINSAGNSSFVKALDTPTIQGVIRFSAITSDTSGVVVDGVVDGLAPGLHGMHVHECGDVSQGCASLGEHYNPLNSTHGAPTDDATKRHFGDLGNICADEMGRASFRFIDSIIDVNDIVGRAVAITEQQDDYGRGTNAQSSIDGNSGKRIACGIIARSAGILQNFKKICACDGLTIWDERDKPLAGGKRSQKL